MKFPKWCRFDQTIWSKFRKTGKVKLLGAATSLFSTRVEWALKLKGVEYEFIKEDITNKSPLLLKYNPIHKKIPVLVHDEKPIVESLIILEYIEDTWKNCPLLPEDPYERYQVRFWAKFNDEKCSPGAFTACLVEGEAKVKAVNSSMEALSLLEKQLEGKKFFGGDKIGYLDLVMAWTGLWLNVCEEFGDFKILDPEKLPKLHAWATNFVQIPLIKECLPERNELVNYFRGMIAHLKSQNPATK